MKKALSLLLLLSVMIGCLSATGLTVHAAENDIAWIAENITDQDANADSENDRQKLLDLEKDLPAKLDLRDYRGENYVTPVKLQNPYGSCWAFAMAAAAEISYLYENDMGVPAGEINDQVDFSEKYISWYMRHALTEEDVQTGAIPASQVGEGFDLTATEESDRNAAYNLPGNPLFGVNFYASGFGPVDESTSVNGEYPYIYIGKNHWRGSDPDEVSEELAERRKHYYYIEYKPFIGYLIESGEMNSRDEYDEWFENNWKKGRNLYARALSQNGYSEFDDWTLPLSSTYRNPEIQAYFKSSYLLPCPSVRDDDGNYRFDRAGVAAIKSELSKGRGVSIGILADQSAPNDEKNDKGYLNTTTWAQYYNDRIKMNHLVTVVGYDDNYAKENFTRTVNGTPVAGSTPPENGAFIVKNSWGALTDEDRLTASKDAFGNTVYQSPNANAWGIDDTGYFYLSYYDHSICTPITFSFYNEEETMFYELNYDQYDLMQDVDYYELNLGKKTVIANIFSAEEDEYLYQISSMISKPMTTIRYQIYMDVADTPESGELIESGEVFKQYAGYQRIDLSKTTFLKKGTRYSVVITQETRNEDNEIYTPVPISLCENYNSANGSVIHSVINKGESFINAGKGWKDFSEYKKKVENFLFRKETADWSQNLIDTQYRNGADDFQIDNFPIKAFLIPARTVTEYLCGDVDLDDKISVLDATTVQRYKCSMIRLSEKALMAADVDSDEKVTILDATWIQRRLADMKAPEIIGEYFLSRIDD